MHRTRCLPAVVDGASVHRRHRSPRFCAVNELDRVQHAETEAIVIKQAGRIAPPAGTVDHRLEIARPADQVLHVSPGQVGAGVRET